MRMRVITPFVDGTASHPHLFGLRNSAEHSEFGSAPPRLIAILPRRARNRDRVGRRLTGVPGAEEFTFLIAETVAIVFIERAVAVITCVHAQFERSVGFLRSVLR